MAAPTVAYEVAEQQGWTDATLLDLCLTYIDRQGDDMAFGDFLTQIVHESSV